MLLPIVGPVIVEKAVAGLRVHMELVGLAILLECLLMLGYLLWRRAFVLLAKQAQQWTGQVLRIFNRSDGLFGCEILFCHHYTPAPAIYYSIKALHSTHCEERMTAANALAAIGPWAREAEAELLRLAGETSGDVVVGHVASAARDALRRIREAAPDDHGVVP